MISIFAFLFFFFFVFVPAASAGAERTVSSWPGSASSAPQPPHFTFSRWRKQWDKGPFGLQASWLSLANSFPDHSLLAIVSYPALIIVILHFQLDHGASPHPVLKHLSVHILPDLGQVSTNICKAPSLKTVSCYGKRLLSLPLFLLSIFSHSSSASRCG